MHRQLNILIATNDYADSTGILPILRELNCTASLQTDPDRISTLPRITDFDALFLPVRSLYQAEKRFLLALKNIPKKIPIFFIADPASETIGYDCTGIKAIDVITTGSTMIADTQRCLRITEHIQTSQTSGSASHIQASKPIYAQLSNMRRFNKLMTEEVSRARLIKQSCNHISDITGCRHVWINLPQHQGGHRAQSGASTRLETSEIPQCIDLKREHMPQIIMRHEGEDTHCPLLSESLHQACLYYPFKHKGVIIGKLFAIIDLELVSNTEFMAMFKQIVDDLACAIHILTEQKKQSAFLNKEAITSPLTANYVRQLEQADQRFQALFREMPRVAVHGYNKNREVIFWNKASEEFYGYTENEALGNKIETLILPELLSEFSIQAITDWDEKGIPIPASERALQHKEGHTVPVFSSHAGFNNLNGNFEMYSLDVNLSEVKAAQDSVQKLSKFPNENPNPVMRVNKDGRILYANPASGPLLKLWNKNVNECIPDDYRECIQTAITQQHAMYHLITCDKQIYSTVFTPISHETEYINIYSMDVTARENAFADLAYAKQMAESANLAKNDFLANMSHELRTPLNGIMGMAQLLELTDLNSEQQTEVAAIIASSHTLLEIITDILDITAIEHEQITIKTEAFDLKKTLQHAIASIQPAADQKKLNLSLNYPLNQPVSFKGDKQRTSQIIGNLLGNAVKFTDTGSITINVAVAKKTIAIAITDTGNGIPIDMQDHIFEKFTQIDASRTRRHGGAGLGLHIAKRLVDRMDGRIDISSKEGEGSTFTVTLPFASVPIEKKSAPPIDRHHNNRKHILLAEDNRVNQLVAKKMLMSLGYNVDLAENGTIALELARNNDYDLIFMDIQMPEMNGLDATIAIRQLHGSHGKTPIIALTAHAMHEDIDACKDAGMDDYLSKPIKLDHLEMMLGHLIPATHNDEYDNA